MLILIGDLENIIDVSSWAIDKLSDNRHDRFIVRKLLRLMVLKDETGIVLLRQVTPCLPACCFCRHVASYSTQNKTRSAARYGSPLPHSTWIFRRHSRPAAFAGMLLAIVLKIRQGVRHATDPPCHIPHGSFAGIAPACRYVL